MPIVRFTAHTLSTHKRTRAHVFIASMLFVDSSMFKTTFIHSHRATINWRPCVCLFVRVLISSSLILVSLNRCCFSAAAASSSSACFFLSLFVMPYFIIITNEVVFLNALYSHLVCVRPHVCVCVCDGVCECECIVLSFLFYLFYFHCLRSFGLLLKHTHSHTIILMWYNTHKCIV